MHLLEGIVIMVVSPSADGVGLFRLRAGYFPGKESSQSSPGLRARTQGLSPVAPVIPAGAGGLGKGVYALSLPLSSMTWDRRSYLF